MGVKQLLIALFRFLVLRVVISPIDLILDTLQGYFSGNSNKINKYIHGNFGPIYKECSPYPLPISRGSLPKDLAGEFVRNGPNPLMIPKGGYHWFDGDGMLHGVRITKDGKAMYINRQTKTKLLEQEKQLGVSLRVRIGELHGKLGLIKVLFWQLKLAIGLIPFVGGTANTSVVFHNKKLQALVESDIPYEIRVLRDGQFETAGRLEYGGKIQAMTAHPKIDPVTKEMFFFNYSIMQPPYCTYGIINTKGDIVRTMPIDLPEPIMMHDFAITEHFALFLDLSLVFNKHRIFTGNVFGFESSHNARVGILDRYAKNSDGIVWFAVPPNVVFHTSNAWEDGDEVILVLCKTTSEYTMEGFAGSFGLTEWRFNMKTREFQEKLILPGVFSEFPVINPNYVGRKTKYTYTVTNSFGHKEDDKSHFRFTGLLKVNLETKEGKVFTYGEGKCGGEGVFVPKENATSEDDGYLLSFVYDYSTDLSAFWVIDAKTMDDIVAIVDLPQRVPYGFHGIFISEEDIESQLVK